MNFSKYAAIRSAAIGLLVLSSSSSAGAQCLGQSFAGEDSVTFDLFGGSISMGPARVVIGAVEGDGVTPGTGAAYVFLGTPTGIVQEAKLFASDGTTPYRFGTSVGLSGSYALIGAPPQGFGSPGKAYVFRRTGTNWNETQILTPSISQNSDRFGEEVAVDGNRALVAAPAGNRVFVYERSFLNWFEVDVITSSSSLIGDDFGKSISLVGNRAVIAAPFDDGAGSSSGTAYVFELIGNSWTEVFELTASGAGANDFFGTDVTLDDGANIVVVAREGEGAVTDAGCAYVYKETAPSTWTELEVLFDPNGDPSDTWRSCDLRDGRLLVNEETGGSVYVYRAQSGGFELEDQFTSTLVGTGLDQNDNIALVGAQFDPNGGTGEVHAFILDGEDCNGNGSPDLCDITSGSSNDLDANGVPDECQCAIQSYCVTNPNSTGSSATISAPMLPSVSANDFVLEAGPAPNEPGIFFYSDTQVQVPFGPGWRCVGGTVNRLLPPAFAAGNVLSRTIDLTTLPTGPLASGDTWNFQAWFRDPAGGPFGFNLSNGIEVQFCP